MTSSDTVVKSVAKKLKYYFQVRRLEDGFDLSDTNVPVLDHPPLKTRSTLQYDGLHDRPLKHYFSQPEVRVQLTQFGLDPQLHNPRERHIKRSLTKNMKKHHFLLTTPDLPSITSWKQPSISDSYYVNSSAGRHIHPALIGFGAAPKSRKKKSLKGGWPVLRSMPPRNISQGEAERLVNSATKLLAAMETVAHLTKNQQYQRFERHNSAARSCETEWELIHGLDPTCVRETNSKIQQPQRGNAKRRPLTAKYTWDINGHRIPSAKMQVKAYDDSYLERRPRHSYLRQRRSPSPSSSSDTEYSSTTVSRSPLPSPRPRSPHHSEDTQPFLHTVINLPPEQVRDEVRVTTPSPTRYDMSSQTEHHLLEYDHMVQEVTGGPWGEYQIYVKTGDRTGASTSADVNVTIYGEKGCTPAIKLATSKYNKVKFQRGKEDLFIVPARHVGKMKKIKIGHDKSQLSYAWFLENVTVHDMNDKKMYDFPCNRWLSGQDDDHRTYRYLPVDRQRAFVEEKSKPPPPSQNKMVTSDLETESDSPLNRKDKTSMRAKHSQRSRRSSSSSTSSSSPESGHLEEAVIRLPASQKDGKKESAKKEKDEFIDQKMPGTVIQFKKKDSQKVEEEVVLDEVEKEGKFQADKQESHKSCKAGQKIAEGSRRKNKERDRDRQLLSGISIHDACRQGDLERVIELLDNFPYLKHSRDESGQSLLHLAAANGHTNILVWLTSADRDDLDLVTSAGYTPLHLAVLNGHLNAASVLNAMGAKTECQTAEKQTLLHLASKFGHLECVKWLIANGADFAAKDIFGCTPGDLANKYGQDAVADFLQICERELANPSSTFAQLHTAQQKGGSQALPTIKEDDKGSNGSDLVQVGSTSSSMGRITKAKEDCLQQKY